MDELSGERRPIPKRLRFEILRRDDHTCRYCGAKAPDVKLTVDHVVPVVLGGDNEPGNLVTACAACNSGKSSSSPDAPIVENVADDALRWAAAMERAAEIQGSQDNAFETFVKEVMEVWDSWEFKSLDGPVEAPADWKHSLRSLYAAGMTADQAPALIEAAMTAQKVPFSRTWRYFCGCAWNKVRERQAVARALIEAESDAE